MSHNTEKDGCESQEILLFMPINLMRKIFESALSGCLDVWTSCGGFSLASLFVWGYLACFYFAAIISHFHCYNFGSISDQRTSNSSTLEWSISPDSWQQTARPAESALPTTSKWQQTLLRPFYGWKANKSCLDLVVLFTSSPKLSTLLVLLCNRSRRKKKQNIVLVLIRDFEGKQ